MSLCENIAVLKKNVLKMVEKCNRIVVSSYNVASSRLWSEELGFFKYSLDVPDDALRNIRFHVELMTEDNCFACWHNYPLIDPDKFARIIFYDFFTDGIPSVYQ